MKPKLHFLSTKSLSYWSSDIPNWSAINQSKEPVYFEPCEEVYAKLGWLLVNGIMIDAIPIDDTTVLPEDSVTMPCILSLNSFKADKLPSGIKITFNKLK